MADLYVKTINCIEGSETEGETEIFPALWVKHYSGGPPGEKRTKVEFQLTGGVTQTASRNGYDIFVMNAAGKTIEHLRHLPAKDPAES